MTSCIMYAQSRFWTEKVGVTFIFKTKRYKLQDKSRRVASDLHPYWCHKVELAFLLFIQELYILLFISFC
jgi:hypothetical protein